MKKQKQFEVPNVFPIVMFCHCAVCNDKIGLNSTSHANGIERLAFFDSYNKSQYAFDKGKGCYVCRIHLSKKRQDELAVQ